MGIAKPFNVICLDDKHGDYKLVQDVEEVRASKIEDEIEAYLADHPDASQNELMKALKKSQPTIKDALERIRARVGDFQPVGAE
jgi:ParB-like chromosome segregation protein Spo0J